MSLTLFTMSEPPQPSEMPGVDTKSPPQHQTISEKPESPESPKSHKSHKRESIPPSFSLKRRGRPPGRPNTTVKESDYEDNSEVQRWNAARVEPPVPAVAINIREAFPYSFLTREAQRTIYQLPCREIIYFVQGWITSRQIASQRPSYVNGLLIHSRGQDSERSCDQCVEKRGKNALGPFLTCRVLQGSFHNSCSNCKWFDTTSSCSLYIGPKPNRKRKAKDSGPVEAAIGGDAQEALVTPPNGVVASPSDQITTEMAVGAAPADGKPPVVETAILGLIERDDKETTVQEQGSTNPDGAEDYA